MTLWETLVSMKRVPFGHHLREGALWGSGLGIRKGVPWEGLVPWNYRQVEPILEILAAGEPEVDV